MIKIDVHYRSPSINDKQYLKHLADIGIFDKQLDVWAFAAAYALKNGLSDEFDKLPGKREDMTELDHLDETTLKILLIALETYKPELTQQETSVVVKELSTLASVGLAAIREEVKNSSLNEIYEFLLKQA